jgi:cytochrome P450
MKSPTGAPSYGAHLYTTAAIRDPYPHYRNLRELGPVVWPSRHKIHALPRYAECRAVLRDDRTFVSTNGVALNPISNRLSRGTTLASDAGRHIGFGQGAHACAGQALARLEVTALLRALVGQVDRIEAIGPPKWALNNIIRRHEHLPLRLTARRSTVVASPVGGIAAKPN